MTATYIARSSAIAARNLGGEMMIMSALDSTLFSLNPAATAIWEAADGRTSLEENQPDPPDPGIHHITFPQ